MKLTKEQLDRIYARTSGRCHICHHQLARVNYGQTGKRGAWEVEHSVPRAKGGTDHMNNLYPAHVSCNRGKQTVTSRTARGWNGKKCAPLSVSKREAAKTENGVLGAVCGGLAGLVVGGPVGAFVGATAGACLGSSQNPDK